MDQLLNKNPDEVLKQLREDPSALKSPVQSLLKTLKISKNISLEQFIQQHVDEEEGMDEVNSEDAEEEDMEDGDSDDVDYFKEISDDDDMDPMTQLKYLSKPVKGTSQEEDDLLILANHDTHHVDDRDMGNRNLLDSDLSEEEREMSSYQRQKSQVLSQARELEEENIAHKSWTLSGEVSAKARPENSLLEQDLVFDFQAVPPPVITEETTDSIEDIIKRRIRERAFDNPEVISAELVEEKEGYQQRMRAAEIEMGERVDLGTAYEQEFLKKKGQFVADTLDPRLKAKYEELNLLYSKIKTSIGNLIYHSANFSNQ